MIPDDRERRLQNVLYFIEALSFRHWKLLLSAAKKGVDSKTQIIWLE
jgi:hypothetical protein